MTKRHAWDDNNYEGKALRWVFTKLLKRFEKEIQDESIELDKLQKIAQRLNLVNTPNPKDQFGDDVPVTGLEKQFNRAKTDFEKFKKSEKPTQG